MFIASVRPSIRLSLCLKPKFGRLKTEFRTYFLTRKAQNMFIASVRPSVRLSVYLKPKFGRLKTKFGRIKTKFDDVRGPRSGPEKLSSADDAGSAKRT